MKQLGFGCVNFFGMIGIAFRKEGYCLADFLVGIVFVFI